MREAACPANLKQWSISHSKLSWCAYRNLIILSRKNNGSKRSANTPTYHSIYLPVRPSNDGFFVLSGSAIIVAIAFFSNIKRILDKNFSIVTNFISIYNFIGWGRLVGGGDAADTLQQAMLPVASHSACSRVNGRLVSVDEKSMVCAGGQGKGGCQVRINCFALFPFSYQENLDKYYIFMWIGGYQIACK